MRPSSRSAAVAAFASSLLVLAGCGGDGSAKPVTTLPAPSSSASAGSSGPASASATSSVSRSPFDRQSEVDFVENYYAALNQAISTGDLTTLREMTSTDCSCTSQLDLIARTYGAGNHFEGGQYAVSGLEPITDPVSTVDFDYTISAATVVHGDGTREGTDPAGSGRKRFTLTMSGGSWKVTRVDKL